MVEQFHFINKNKIKYQVNHNLTLLVFQVFGAMNKEKEKRKSDLKADETLQKLSKYHTC